MFFLQWDQLFPFFFLTPFIEWDASRYRGQLHRRVGLLNLSLVPCSLKFSLFTQRTQLTIAPLDGVAFFALISLLYYPVFTRAKYCTVPYCTLSHASLPFPIFFLSYSFSHFFLFEILLFLNLGVEVSLWSDFVCGKEEVCWWPLEMEPVNC